MTTRADGRGGSTPLRPVTLGAMVHVKAWLFDVDTRSAAAGAPAAVPGSALGTPCGLIRDPEQRERPVAAFSAYTLPSSLPR
jgi:hypothetical protein